MPTRWRRPPPPSPAGGSAACRRSARPCRRWAAPAGRSLWSASAAAKLMTGYWRPPMPRLASLYLPALPIDRIRRSERGGKPPPDSSSPSLLGEGDHPKGGGGANGVSQPLHHAAALRGPPPRASSGRIAPRAPGFRPGARWSWDEEVRQAVLPTGSPMVTAERSGPRVVLAAVAPEAQALGLAPGMPLTQARM